MTCSTCNDTHWMEIGDSAVMCTHCPTPCQRCRNKNGAYCDDILGPCTCSCHESAAPNRPDVSLVAGLTAAWEAAHLTPCDPDDYSALDSDMVREIRGITDAAGFDGIPFLDDAVRCAIDKGAPALHRQLSEASTLATLRLQRWNEEAESLRDVILLERARADKAEDLAKRWEECANAFERERDGFRNAVCDHYVEAMIVAADDVFNVRPEDMRRHVHGLWDDLHNTRRERAEARAAAEVQADALAEQAADMERLRRRLNIEFEKTKAMNRALGEVWEQVPDEDRIGKPADQWVRGLGRRVRELQRVAARACGAGPVAEDERTV